MTFSEMLQVPECGKTNAIYIKNILKEHRDYNNPSQIDFENLGGAESTIKEISSDLEHLYEKAKVFVKDKDLIKEYEEEISKDKWIFVNIQNVLWTKLESSILKVHCEIDRGELWLVC